MNNEKDLTKWSNPKEAQKQAYKYLGKNAKLYYSTRKNKKYQIQDPEGNWVHFGFFGAEDFTKHRSEEKRRLFRNRNAKWKDAERWSPAWLSYHILW